MCIYSECCLCALPYKETVLHDGLSLGLVPASLLLRYVVRLLKGLLWLSHLSEHPYRGVVGACGTQSDELLGSGGRSSVGSSRQGNCVIENGI